MKTIQNEIVLTIICEYSEDYDLYSCLFVNHLWYQMALGVLLKRERDDIRENFASYEQKVLRYENSGWGTCIMKDSPIVGLWEIFMKDYHPSLKDEVFKLFFPLKFRIERLMIAEYLLTDKSNINKKEDRKNLHNCEWFYKIPLLGENQCNQCRGIGAEWNKK
jgi:hypothetical protein